MREQVSPSRVSHVGHRAKLANLRSEPIGLFSPEDFTVEGSETLQVIQTASAPSLSEELL